MVKHYSKNYKRKQEWQKRSRIPLNYSLPKAILDILFDFSETFPLFTFGSYKKLCRRSLGIPDPPRWRFNRAIKYLEKRGQLKVVNQNDQLFLKLTKKGKIQALLCRIEKNYKKEPKWDGKWRIVIWDIPESANNYRNRFRYFLKNLGFYRLQQSVFINPYPLPGTAVAYLKESGLLKFIRFLRVDKIDDDRFLRKHFGLES